MVLATQYVTRAKTHASTGHITHFTGKVGSGMSKPQTHSEHLITFTGKVGSGMSNAALYINAETAKHINIKYKR